MRFTKFTAGLVALSIATAGVAVTPAHAGDEEVAWALGGLLALLVISEALDDDKPKPVETTKDNKFSRPVLNPPHYGEKIVPAYCVEKVRYQGETKEMATQDCLVRTVKVKDLPSKCDEPVRTRSGGVTTAYDLKCLEKNGFKVREGLARFQR
ncbi:hypothetical protein [Celeribacter litoreus]|uniref:hypothetical protein n=1 Tax=Celeribacter litoreus TaxID=2876714 RepID=UPI001CC9D8BC|nr:hypothetical protein [Celeribacter litoreus]MCA0041949.1 hypothetical protein [Celeribacter litoreus]